MDYLSAFRMPVQTKITGRSSSITNAFISAIIPVVRPSAEEVRNALDILGMTPETIECAYCGSRYTEWDHLHPIVVKKRPTGYISEIHNLVPSCNKCNQSKGNSEWKEWMLGRARLSPTALGVPDIAMRIHRLEEYEKRCQPTKLNFEALVANDDWRRHQENLEHVQGLLRESQQLATKISMTVAKAFRAHDQHGLPVSITAVPTTSR